MTLSVLAFKKCLKMNSFELRLIVLICVNVNVLSVSSQIVDSRHYTQLYGNRLVPDDQPSYINSKYVGNTGFPLYEQQLRDYERNAKVHMEARNEQIKQYKEYNTRYTETAHENINTVTASTTDTTEKTDTTDKTDKTDKAEKSVDTPGKTSSQFVPRDPLGFPTNPQVEEDISNVLPAVVSRSNIKPPVRNEQTILRKRKHEARDVIMSERESRTFLKDPSYDEGIIMEYLANPAIQ